VTTVDSGLSVALADVHEARANLEAAGVSMLATRRSAADLRRLDAALAEGNRPLDDPVTYGGRYDLAFHRLLVECAGNDTMVVLLAMVFAVIDRHTAPLLADHRGDQDVDAVIRCDQRAHQKLVELIRRGAADEASDFWYRHLCAVGRYLTTDRTERIPWAPGNSGASPAAADATVFRRRCAEAPAPDARKRGL
jgi:DNA-binding FadR family transcriptional regulator